MVATKVPWRHQKGRIFEEKLFLSSWDELLCLLIPVHSYSSLPIDQNRQDVSKIRKNSPAGRKSCSDNNNNKLYYQIEKLNLIYTHKILIQKKVTFTQNNWKANLAE